MHTFAQSDAYVLAPFDHDKESAKDFKKKTKALIKKILANPASSGFIAIRASTYQDSLEFRKITVYERDKRKELGSRLEIWHPVAGYNKHIERTEFWFVPAGS